jgi:two-component system sensor histidine kinase YesM
MEEKISASAIQLLSLVNVNMITELEKYQYLCGSFCINDTIQNALRSDTMTSGEKNKIVRSIQDLVDTQIIYPAQAKNITIYDKNGNIFYDLGYDGFYEEDRQKIMKDIYDQAPNDSWNYVKTYRQRNIITLGRRILDGYNDTRVLGYTVISIDEKLFSETVLTPVNLEEGTNILFMKPDGTVLSSWDRAVSLGVAYQNGELIDQLQKSYPSKNGSFTMNSGENTQLITYSYNKNFNLYFVSIIPFSYINSETVTVVRQLIMVALPLLLFCITITLIIYLSISKPINHMVSHCNQISSGNFNDRIEDKHRDELSFLSNNLDNMVDKIEQLIYEQKADEQKKRELEMQMLQYQINPHFLFNTLNSLRLVAAMNQDHIVSEGITALANLLKNVLVDKHEYITVGEEIENLKNYFAIQSIRYAGNFQVSYEVEESILSCAVPKLILQPLAENSVIHGTTESGYVMQIKVSCRREEDQILLELSDNGKGFDMGNMSQKEIAGIGIPNVNDRIQLNFGSEYGLYITSEPGKGTTCQITLPVVYATPENPDRKTYDGPRKGVS